MLYVTWVWPAQGLLGPDIILGVAGAAVVKVTACVLAVLDPQPFAAVTEMVPAPVPAATEILVVPCPEIITQPAGTVQV